MSYSTITKKKCKCSIFCQKWPTIGYGGYFSGHAPQELKEKIGIKKQVAQKNRNNRLALGRKLHEVQNVVSGAEMNRWFADRREEMTGRCANCSGSTNKDNDIYYRYCIGHLLPKSHFPSVKTNVNNWIELCYFGNGCHPQMDNKLLDLIDMACFDTIVTRFVAMYPDIAENEKRRIPAVLLQYVEVEK